MFGPHVSRQYAVVQSRGFSLPAEAEVGATRWALVPVADFLNHTGNANADAQWRARGAEGGAGDEELGGAEGGGEGGGGGGSGEGGGGGGGAGGGAYE